MDIRHQWKVEIPVDGRNIGRVLYISHRWGLNPNSAFHLWMAIPTNGMQHMCIGSLLIS